MSITFGNGITLGAGVSATAPVNNLLASLDASNPTSYPGSGTLWYDLSGKNNDFIIIGDAPYTPNGQQSYFTFSSGIAQGGTILPNQAYTKVAIFRTLTGNFGNIISGDSGNQHAFWGTFGPYLQSGHNGSWSTVLNPTSIPVNQWVFVAVTFNTTTGWSLYLNNLPVVTNANTDTFTVNPAQVTIGGYDGNGNNLQGDLAVAQIYNTALTDSEIAALYTIWQSRFGLPT
jgi:hypothetical protein